MFLNHLHYEVDHVFNCKLVPSCVCVCLSDINKTTNMSSYIGCSLRYSQNTFFETYVIYFMYIVSM